jgi:hypothetical protein
VLERPAYATRRPPLCDAATSSALSDSDDSASANRDKRATLGNANNGPSQPYGDGRAALSDGDDSAAHGDADGDCGPSYAHT